MNKNIIDICLINGNITIFCGMHTDTFKNDVLNSTLYSQLLATRGGNEREAWWSTYSQTLNRFGWTLDSRGIKRLEFHNASLFDIALEGTESYLPIQEQQALAGAFSELKKLPENSLIIQTIITKLQDNASNDSGDTPDAHPTNLPVPTATLLTIVCNDQTVVNLQIAFKTTNEIALDILDQPVLTTIEDGKNNIRLLRSKLDERQYSELREAIIKKLGNKIKTDLLHVNAPN